jgi:serine hydrolase
MSETTTLHELRILLVPGAGDSGPDHWDRCWESEDHRVERVVQANWIGGTRDQWVGTLDRHVRSSDRPAILVAHSLGNIVVSHWAAAYSGAVVGALLVAPADIDAEWAGEGSVYHEFRPIPMNPLPFPSLLAASTDDRFLSLARARDFAAAWGSRLHIVGPLGHIGSDSKLERWEDGRRLLDQVVKQSLHAG